MKRKYINYVAMMVAFMLAWSFFTFSDYCEENHLFHYDAMMTIGLLVVPVIIPILYLVFEKHINSVIMSRAKNTLAIMGIWLVINAVIGFAVSVMINNNKWIVKQATGGLENFLNGIEYMIFPFFLGIIPIIIVAIWRLICLIYHKVKKG